MYWLRWHYHVKDIAGAPYTSLKSEDQGLPFFCRSLGLSSCTSSASAEKLKPYGGALRSFNVIQGNQHVY